MHAKKCVTARALSCGYRGWDGAVTKSVRCTVAVRGGRHVSTRYCSGGGWTNQSVTRGTEMVHVSTRYCSGGGWTNQRVTRGTGVCQSEEPPLPYFIPEPVYLEFMPPEDDVLLAEEQPLPAAVSPTADSPSYITKSDPEEGSKEDDEDLKEDLVDYPIDKDDDDDKEEESFRDDADEEEEDEDDDEEEEEEHLASANSVPPPAHRTTARMFIQAQTPIPFLSKIPSPPLPVSSLLSISPSSLPASPTHSLGYRAAMIRLRAESPYISHPLPLLLPIVLPHTMASLAMIRAATTSTYILAPRSETPPLGTPPLLPILLPTSSPPLLLPSTDYRLDVPMVGECSSAPSTRPTGGFRADYGFVGTLDAEIRHDPDREIGCGITNFWVDPDEIIEEIPVTDIAELGQRMKDFFTTVRQDIDEIYGRLNDVQDDRLLMSGQLNLLHSDRRTHARTARLMDSEARASPEAWVQSIDASDTIRSKVNPLWNTVLAQQTEIRDMWAADRRRQA
ncbi:hypothetical protein Tco_0199105 [Tanacetum coccineum]